MFFWGLFLLHFYCKGLLGQVTIVDQHVESVLVYSALGKSVDLTYIIKFEKYGNPEKIEVDVRSPSNSIKILFSYEFIQGSYKIKINNNSDMSIYKERIQPELDQKQDLTVKFTFKNTQAIDFGSEYRCTVHYPNLNLCYGTIVLHEAVSPKINDESFLPKEYVPINGNKKFICEAKGTPTPMVHWSSNTKIDIKEKQGNGSSTFEINNAQKGDSSKYSCIAANDGGTVVKEMELFVSYIEYLSEINIFTRHVEKGAEVREPCKIHGYPNLSWIWKNPAQKIISTDQFLVFGDIGSPGKNEFGNYTCFASNSIGHREYVLKLVRNEPTLITASKSVGTGKLIQSSTVIVFGIYFVNIFLAEM